MILLWVRDTGWHYSHGKELSVPGFKKCLFEALLIQHPFFSHLNDVKADKTICQISVNNKISCIKKGFLPYLVLREL